LGAVGYFDRMCRRGRHKRYGLPDIFFFFIP
jgi:hypothetical protein